ncbi:MAG: Rab family GTPase [Promethearchaeota archaeon]
MGEIKQKIIVVGDPAVGKTSLVKKYTKGEFQKEYISTLGAQFSRYEEIVNDDVVELIIWDIAGQETYNMMRQKFYIGSGGAIIVFSHSSKESNSFDRIDKWVEEIRKYCGEIPLVLFGNKIDLIDLRELEENTSLNTCDTNVNHLMEKTGFLGYFKTSALTGLGVIEAFQVLVKELYKNSMSE